MRDAERILARAARRLPAAPDTGFAAAAARRALLDVAYASVATPFGDMLVAATPRGLLVVSLRGPADEALAAVAARVSPRIVEAPARLDRVRRQLDEYFGARRRTFDLDLDWSLVRGFSRKVLRATARIPYGAVSTYRDVARRAGNGRASRAAGNALHSNPIPIVVPCHRVVRTGGDLGGYGGGLDMKEALLRLEGAID